MIDRTKIYPLDEALALLKKNSREKFAATLELHLRLGIDPKKSEQQVRGTVLLPHGSGKKQTIAVFVPDAQLEQIEADLKKLNDGQIDQVLVGGDEFIEEIRISGRVNFDIALAHPAAMKSLTRIAKLLGPKGLMPSLKSETVTEKIPAAVQQLLHGKTIFKNDDTGNLHLGVGKISWPVSHLKDNLLAALQAIKKAKPAGVRGNFIKRAYLSTTMSPSVRFGV